MAVRTYMYKVAMHNRIHDSVMNLDVQCTRVGPAGNGAPAVC